ncbi:MAG: GNAT family N-acetyltransferase [Bacteroidetes bacterium]|nr:GNAT family N-acetyltransferase [Bacteroidota bacterium]
MEIIIKEFKALSTLQLFEIYQLRSEVFIVEQSCAYQDVDGIDLKAEHLLLMEAETLAAYARIIPPGISYKEPSIGRVVVKKQFRGKDLGKILMKECLKYMVNEPYKNKDIVISAQSYLIKFYTDLGFKAEGEGYLEDDIPHTKMRFKPV